MSEQRALGEAQSELWKQNDAKSQTNREVSCAAMAETVYTISSDLETPKKPFPKRRRYITSTPPIPVYSTKVQNSLNFLNDPTKLPDRIKELCKKNLPFSSEDEDEEEKPIPLKQLKPYSRIYEQTFKKLNLNLFASKILDDEAANDDVVLVDVFEPRELVLKVRFQADLYKVCILMTEPIQRVVDRMSEILKVDPKRIILLHDDCELQVDSTPAKLDLGVADIIDCLVDTSNKWADPGSLLLRVQGKDRNSMMEITVQKGEPLVALMNHYKQAQGLGRSHLVFYFDGKHLAETATPEQMEMESGDVIEVWN